MILVFVGAGGSAAVDSKQYPTTRGFFEKLPSGIINAPSFTEICRFLKDMHGIDKPDIENVLEALDELLAHLQNSTDPTEVAGWFIQASSLIPKHRDFQESIETLKTDIPVLKDKINERIYHLYYKTPDSEDLLDWCQLFEGLVILDPALEVFTTNYDRVLENVIKRAEVKIETGRRFDEIQTRLDDSFWAAFMPAVAGRNGLLTKLHGSVDWQRSNEGINISETFTGNHDNHCILYPGYKGEPTEDPFRMFHNHLREVVGAKRGKLTAAIFIGYAFRDEYINSILNQLPSDTPAYYVTKPEKDEVKRLSGSNMPLPPPGAPTTNTYSHFVDGFTKDIVDALLQGVSVDRKQRK